MIFIFETLQIVTASTSQVNRSNQTDSEQADVDPSLAAVADYLVFGQARAQARAQAWAQAQAQTWAERGPSEPIRPKAAQQHAPRHPKC